MASSLLSSSNRSHKRTISIDSLPEELLLEISSRIAASSFSAVCNLRLVSKPFRHTCDDKYILSRLSLDELPMFPWFHNRERFSNFFKRCRRNGNPEALYRKGFINYFLENNELKGLKLLAKASAIRNQLLEPCSNRRSCQEATYVYGLILICLGGKTKQKGFEILSSLIKPLMSKTMETLVELRYKIRGNVWWRGIPVMKKLKSAYIQEKCECDGRTIKFLVQNCVWHRYGEDNDMNTSSACEFCLWHYEVELFFANID